MEGRTSLLAHLPIFLCVLEYFSNVENIVWNSPSATFLLCFYVDNQKRNLVYSIECFLCLFFFRNKETDHLFLNRSGSSVQYFPLLTQILHNL